ncbi:MAG: DUF6261 family protein [Tannerellaceae bacterium]|jgi:hypothetical protein|nr:DUF6261 family protein [Tannerellaceae bacterium]
MTNFKIEKYAKLLKDISISNHYAFVHDLRIRLQQEISQVPALTESWNKLVLAFNHEDEAYKHHKLFETKQIVELDNWRISLLTGMAALVRMRLKSMTEAERKAADMLETEVFQTYRTIHHLNYEAKTSDIINLIEDLNSNKHRSAVITLQLQALLNELTAANTEFNVKFNERAEEYRQVKELGSATDARPATDEALKNFTDTLEALYKSNEASTKDLAQRAIFEKCFFIINSVIDHARKTYIHQKSHGEEDGDETPPGGGIG